MNIIKDTYFHSFESTHSFGKLLTLTVQFSFLSSSTSAYTAVTELITAKPLNSNSVFSPVSQLIHLLMFLNSFFQNKTNIE